MKIEQDKRVISGKHDNEEFSYESGVLQMFNVNWSKDKIKKLVEVANLLEHQNLPVIRAFSTRKKAHSTIVGEVYYTNEEVLPGEETEEELS